MRKEQANGKPQLLPPVYFPYPMLLVPYGNNISPLGPAPNAVGVRGSTVGAFLHANHIHEPQNFIPPATWDLRRPIVLSSLKKPRDTYQNPLFQQRAVANMNSDEVSLENNQVTSQNSGITQRRSGVQMVTEAPSSDDPISFSRGTNDHSYAAYN